MVYAWTHNFFFLPFISVFVFPSPRCRHWAIACYFGDEKPICNKSCDVCAFPKRVSQLVEDLDKGVFVKNGRYGGGGFMMVSDDPDPELYGGGRKGQKR